MNIREHLLGIAAEECCETAQALIKAVRFGLDDTNPKENKTALEVINHELNDLYGLIRMLREEGIDIGEPNEELIAAKVERVKYYMQYSRDRGIMK